MTLQDFIDNVTFNLRQSGLKKIEIPPPEAMRRLIKRAREHVAEQTRCLRGWSKVKDGSKIDQAKYKISADCLDVLDLYYDGVLRDYITPYEMNYHKQHGNTGTPSRWTYYGGRNQPSGFIYLDPTPTEDGKEIKIQTIQLPQILTDLDSVCELSPIYQNLVEDTVFAIILRNRGNRQWTLLNSFVDNQMIKHICNRAL